MREFILYHGDCVQHLKTLPDNFFDSMITDPPAGINFMGKDWDSNKGGSKQWITWLTSVMQECLRVLKPGAHALVWAIPRTSHWTATALENAGFEVRDRVSHLFGTGFPKSLNLGDGRGTALKPAVEDWWLVRKPLDGTVEKNVNRYGTGALNIDACRIGTDDNLNGGAYAGGNRSPVLGDDRSAVAAGMYGENGRLSPNEYQQPSGRWPAHLVLSHSEDCKEQGCSEDCAVRMLDEQSGISKDGVAVQRNGGGQVTYGGVTGIVREDVGFGGKGGASRFFYCAKASTSERDVGLDHLPKKSSSEIVNRDPDSAGINNPRAGAGRTSSRANSHPTVKALSLMKYLIKLITPPGGTILDPFMGSGSTGVAAVAGGYDFIGIEKEIEYMHISEGRIKHAYSQTASK